jgi:hypothetical protein
MKKTIILLIVFIFTVSKIYSQEIKIKRQFFVPYPQYFADEKYIGNSTSELIRFVEEHSQDSTIIQQLYASEKLSKNYSKIYIYSSCAVGAGGLGLTYVLIKGFSSVVNLRNNADPNLGTIALTSLGVMSVGLVGIVVGTGYMISSQVKIKKAIKGYNNGLQPKISFEVQPFMDSNFSAGLSLKMTF